MKTTRSIQILALAAFTCLTAAAAHAENNTIVVMHRNINNVQDEQNWSELARGLSAEGFRVVSVAMDQDESAQTASSHVIKLLDETGYNDKVLLVGTASASEAISNVAQAEPTRVQALVYVSASDAVPAFGPRNVSAPVALQGVVPSYQVKVTNEKHLSAKTEGGAMVFKVREQGHSTLARTEDMVEAINAVSHLVKKTAVVRS